MDILDFNENEDFSYDFAILVPKVELKLDVTDRLELSCCSFSKIFHFLERVLMEHKNMKK